MHYPKHYETGDALPALQQGRLRLYCMQFCPFAHRARLVAEAKGLEYEVINCHLDKKPKWLLERSATGQVPVLEHDGKILCESLIVAQYLDDAYPGRTLTSPDPYRRASDNMIITYFGNKIAPLCYGLFKVKESDIESMLHELTNALLKLEEMYKKRVTPFFSGDTSGMLDFMIWPWFFSLIALPDRKSVMYNVPGLKQWTNNMSTDKAVKSTTVSPGLLFKYYTAYRSGNAVFDFE